MYPNDIVGERLGDEIRELGAANIGFSKHVLSLGLEGQPTLNVRAMNRAANRMSATFWRMPRWKSATRKDGPGFFSAVNP